MSSAGKIKGLRGVKLGNSYLRWAFGEAAIIAKRDPVLIGPLYQRLEARMNGNKFKANTVLAIKLARSVYLRFTLSFDRLDGVRIGVEPEALPPSCQLKLSRSFRSAVR